MYDFTSFKNEVKNIEDWLVKAFSTVRTGRATPALLDGVKVDSYGSSMPINQVAGITTEDPKTLRINPWDASQIKEIEKAIVVADLGVSVVVDDKGLRVIFPDLTAERRQSLVKLAKDKLEEAKVSLRGEREKIWSDIQAKQKDGDISEDEKFKLKDDMQKMVDDAGIVFEGLFDKKEKEILE